MILLVRPKLLRKNFNGMTVWPFVILQHAELKNEKIFINHERIHLKQQMEMLVIFFYLWYSLEFLIRLVQYRNRHQAYRNISFEREAYQNENNLEFLTSRRFFNFLKFI